MSKTKIEFTITKTFTIDKEGVYKHYQEYMNACIRHNEYILTFHPWLLNTLTDDNLLIYPNWVEDVDNDTDIEGI